MSSVESFTPQSAPGAPAPQRSGLSRDGRLPSWYMFATGLAGAALAALVIFLASGRFSIPGIVVLGYVFHVIIGWGVARWFEGARWARDRLATLLVTGAFALAIIPLVSLLWEVTVRGLNRLVNPTVTGGFWTSTMEGIFGGMVAGGIAHAIVGTLLITLAATIISVPIGFFTSIYLVEYGNPSWLARGITFLVDVMTGIPSIVAGLFAFSVFTVISQNYGITNGMMGAVALSVLMIPTVVRSSEEMLRLVPNELREASYALGVPKWLTIVKVVLRTSIAGLSTSVTLAIARVIGETAPLLVTVGVIPTMNTNVFEGAMMTLPTYINSQYSLGLAVCANDTMMYMGQQVVCDTGINTDRAWAAALTLIIVVMVLNIGARIVSWKFKPKSR
jgi:phosphate transport system permease protein